MSVYAVPDKNPINNRPRQRREISCRIYLVEQANHRIELLAAGFSVYGYQQLPCHTMKAAQNGGSAMLGGLNCKKW